MPADYIAVRDSCIKQKENKNGKPITEKQIQNCKRIAAMWWVKKHGKPFPKHENANYVDYDLTDLVLEKSYNDIVKDNAIPLKLDKNIIFASIEDFILQQDNGFYFTQPFLKEEVNYKKAEIDESGYLDKICIRCIHFVNNNNVSNDESGFCHLVQGLIDEDSICEQFAKGLMQSKEEDELETSN